MIPRITKGSGITGAIRYNLGEGRDKLTNERLVKADGAESRSSVLGGQNFGFAFTGEDIDPLERVELARRIMEFNALPENQAAKTRKCKKDALHMSLSWARGQDPTRAEMVEAAQSALKALGMERAQAVFFVHSDMPQVHLHIVASRIDPISGRTFSDTMDNVKAIGWSLRWEREHDQITEARRDLHALANAAIARDPDKVVDLLTERNPTFAAKDVKLALMYGELPEKEVRALTEKILTGDRLIGLRENAGEPIKRFTTREVLADERQVQTAARTLAEDRTHEVSVDARRKAAIKHGLNKEQAEALHRATGPEGFTMVAGQAGTGKSRAMEAMRDAYEAEGYRVVGLSPQNKVAQEMREKGFAHAATVDRELGLRPNGNHSEPARAPSATWDAQTILLVDEASMLSTAKLATLLDRAQQAGAKVLLAGDDRQIQSIERGGMFAPLVNEYGAARLAEIQRNKSASQREAWGLAHKGEFAPALDLHQKDGMLHWSATGPAAEADLLKRYSADFKAAPEKSRFIFAHTNEQVDRLNTTARKLMRDAGKLGPDHVVQTKDGPQVFAAGDRVQFSGGGKDQERVKAGFVNGTAGTIKSITEKDGAARLVVKTDAGKELRFTVGEGKAQFNAIRPGYAGTIFKGQGQSIDQTYLLVSKGWDATLSYVATTRHKEGMAAFIAKDVAPDLATLAKVMSRDPGRGAASGFEIDQASLARSGLRDAAAKMQGHRDALHGLDEPARGNSAAGTSKLGVGPVSHETKAAKAPQTGKEGIRSAGGVAGAAKPAAVASPTQKGRKGVASGIAGLAGKAAGAAMDGVASIVEGLFAAKPAPTPEQKIENAKAEAVQEVAAKVEAKAIEADRLAEQEQRDRDALDYLEKHWGVDTEKARRREQEARDRDGGREIDRGR